MFPPRITFLALGLALCPATALPAALEAKLSNDTTLGVVTHADLGGAALKNSPVKLHLEMTAAARRTRPT